MQSNETRRCQGLDHHRRRCTAPAIDGSNYCAAHQPTAPQIEPMIESPARGLLGRFLTRAPQTGVPDTVRHKVDGALKNKSTEQVCAELLHNENTNVRWNAAFALRRRRDPAAIEALWHALQNDPVSLVRQQCAVALGKIGTPAVLAPLIEALWHDRDAGVRQACAIALGNLGYQIASKDLADVLGRDLAAFVRWDCALSLGQLGDHTVIGVLTELAQSDSSAVVRNACKEALAMIKQQPTS